MTSLTYRPAIDGLRALAVTAVMIYHLNSEWLPGGFTGVDVFFVISGYLITSILVREADHSQLSLLRFYQRRIARILPAFLAMAVTTIAVASWIYSPQDYALAAGYMAASVLSVTNVKLMFQGSYFELLPDAHPFLHCWSLSLEEQFYFILPFVILLFKGRRRSFLMPALLVMAATSFILCIWLTAQRPIWSFYFLPSRGWELLAGVMLAVFRIDGGLTNSVFQTAAKWLPTLGIGLVIAGFWLVGEVGFPGVKSLLPVIGTVFLIGACESGQNHTIMRILGSRPLVMVGKWSYSLYLWHWPIFALVDYRLLQEDEWPRVLMKVTLTVACSIICYKLVENPVRYRLAKPRFQVPAYGLLGLVLILCVPWALSSQRRNYINSKQGAAPPLVFDAADARQTWMLMGDSHGSMYGKTLLDYARQRDIRLIVASSAALDALPGADERPNPFWNDSLAAADQYKPDVIVLACAWSAYLDPQGIRLDMAIKSLTTRTRKLIILTQPPILPSSATRERIRNGARPPFFENEQDKSLRLSRNQQIEHVASPNVYVIDVDNLLREGGRPIPFFGNDGRLLYHDRSHLSAFGAAKIVPLLDSVVSAVTDEEIGHVPAPVIEHIGAEVPGKLR